MWVQVSVVDYLHKFEWMGMGTAAWPVVTTAAVITSLWVIVAIFHLVVSSRVIVVAGDPVSRNMVIGVELSSGGQWG